MAIRKNSGNGSGGGRRAASPVSGLGRGKRMALFCLLLLLALALVAGMVLLLLRLPGSLTARNPRFTLKRIKVSSSGYWQGRDRELARRINVTAGTDNLFALDAGAIRRRVLGIQNVDSCEVLLVLPDTLELNLTERVPRAVLFASGGNTVVDEFGFQFKRGESSAAKHRLPVIYGFRAGVEMTRQMAPALALIMTTIRDYPDISVEAVSVSSPYRMTVRLTYRGQRCTAIFPLRQDYRFLLNTLQSSILKIAPTGVVGRTFDLQYSGRVVMPR